MRNDSPGNALRYFPRIVTVSWRGSLPTNSRPMAGSTCIDTGPITGFMPVQSTSIPRAAVRAAIMHMIDNNLDPAIAQHPYELVTYGGNGAVFQNWPSTA